MRSSWIASRNLTFFKGPSLTVLVHAGAWQALILWTSFFMRVGFETQTMSLSEAGNLLSGLKRSLLQLIRVSAVPCDITIQAILKPLWGMFSHWKGWEPYDFRTPVPELLAMAMMGAAHCLGWTDMVVFTALGFYCLLRPGEALGLQPEDFYWPGDALHDSALPGDAIQGVVTIRNPKIRRKGLQHVLIELRWMLLLLQDFLGRLPRGSRALPWTELQLLRRWRLLLRVLKLPYNCHMPEMNLRAWTPAGLRSGSATQDYLRWQNLDRLLWRGRWSQITTLKHYIQLGVYHTGAQQFLPHQRTLLTFYANTARTCIMDR
jgi:hypothetical protein